MQRYAIGVAQEPNQLVQGHRLGCQVFLHIAAAIGQLAINQCFNLKANVQREAAHRVADELGRSLKQIAVRGINHVVQQSLGEHQSITGLRKLQFAIKKSLVYRLRGYPCVAPYAATDWVTSPRIDCMNW